MSSESLNRKTFWLYFFKDPATGFISAAISGHNARAEYRDNPYYIGTEKIEINSEELKK